MFKPFNLRFLCLALWAKHWWAKHWWDQPCWAWSSLCWINYVEAWIAEDLNQSEFDALVYAIWTKLSRCKRFDERQIVFTQGKTPILVVNMNEPFGSSPLMAINTKIQLDAGSTRSDSAWVHTCLIVASCVLIASWQMLPIGVYYVCVMVVLLLNIRYVYVVGGVQPGDHKLSQYT